MRVERLRLGCLGVEDLAGRVRGQRCEEGKEHVSHMGLDCPRVKPRGIAAAAGESGLGAPSGDAGLGRFNLHSLEIGMLRKARGRPLRWSGSTHHDR